MIVPLLFAVVVGLASTAPAAFADVSSPYLSGASAFSGPDTGGQLINLRGGGLTGARYAVFGATRVPVVKQGTGSAVMVRTPAHAAATVAMRVVTDHGTSPVSRSAYYSWRSTVPTTRSSSPAYGGTGGGALVRVYGSYLSRVQGVFFGATPAPIVSAGTGTSVVVRAPGHAAGAVKIKVKTWRGTTPARLSTTFTYVNPPSVSTVAPGPHNDDHWSGESLSVTGAHFSPSSKIVIGTVAVPTKWYSASSLEAVLPMGFPNGPQHVRVQDEYGTSVATDSDVRTFFSTWRPLPGPGTDLFRMTCPSASWCMAIGYKQYFVFDSGTWTTVDDDRFVHPQALACPRVRYCVAGVDSVGYAAVSTFDQTSWSPSQIIDRQADGLVMLRCPDRGTCLGLDGSRTTYALYNGEWLTMRSAGDPPDVASMACVSGDFCLATDDVGVVHRWNGTTWTIESVPDYAVRDSQTKVGCASATFCVVTDPYERRFWVWDGVAWQARPQVDPFDEFEDVDCTSTVCMLVAGSGRIVRLTPTSTTGGAYDENGGGRSSISCWGPGLLSCRVVNGYRSYLGPTA